MAQFLTAIFHGRRSVADRDSRPRNSFDLVGLGQRKANDADALRLLISAIGYAEAGAIGKDSTKIRQRRTPAASDLPGVRHARRNDSRVGNS